MESDKQLVFLYAACIEVFPTWVSVDIPSSLTQVSSPLLMCSWRAPLLCHLCPSSSAYVVATAAGLAGVAQPTSPFLWGGSLEKVLLPLGEEVVVVVAVTLVPALPGGRVCIQAGSHTGEPRGDGEGNRRCSLQDLCLERCGGMPPGVPPSLVSP